MSRHVFSKENCLVSLWNNFFFFWENIYRDTVFYKDTKHCLVSLWKEGTPGACIYVVNILIYFFS
jgi:hypothetical protein